MAKKAWPGIACFALLAGCGGGGGGGGVSSTPTPPADTSTPVVSTPTPVTPTPVAPVTPTPVAVNYDDAEYARSNGAYYAGALTAYKAGASGAGIKLAILDSGIAQIGTEFAGRIDAASRDFGGNTSIADIDGHGTAVAAVAAASRDGANIEGVAWGSTILALRTDSAGTCAQPDGCAFSTGTLATAIDYARTSGARVINMSLGGSPASTSLTAAINRATAAGIIIVIAAGNDADAQPDVLAQVAANAAAARGLVIIAGAHDASGTLSSFSNKAGSYGQYYLTALGSRVRAFDNTGTAYLYSGTSFAAPEIAGAVALLAQAFPNLSAAQIVALLYSSATDAGATGNDATYGNGILNIARAFRPAGTTSLAGGAIAVTEGDATILSGAMGDAKLTGQGMGRAIVLDSYGRAFGMDLAARTAQAAIVRPLAQAIGGDVRSSAMRIGGVDLGTSVARGIGGEPWAGFAQRGRGFRPDQPLRPIAGTAIARLDARTTMGFAFGAGGRALADSLAPLGGQGSFLAALAPGETPGFAGRRDASLAVRHAFGGFALIASAERGAIATLRARDPATPGYTLAALAIERYLGALRLRAGVGALDERATLLGARLAPAFGRAGATTRFVDLDARWLLGRGWQAGMAWRIGRTDAAAGGALAGGMLATRSAAIDLGRQGALSRFGLRFAMPTRVTGGALRLTVPTSYDYATGAIGYDSSRLALTPAGSERVAEANWGRRLAGGWLDGNLFYRRQPGNVAAAPDDIGAAIRYSLAL